MTDTYRTLGSGSHTVLCLHGWFGSSTGWGEDFVSVLDGETFRSEIGRPIFLKLAQPLSFVRIAA